MSINPKRGEIWLINLDPTLGAEIKKTRPALVVNSDYIGKLPLKLVVPITHWQSSFSDNLWHISLTPTSENGLTKLSAADVLQLRSVDLQRFIRKLGYLSISDLQETITAIAIIIECDHWSCSAIISVVGKFWKIMRSLFEGSGDRANTSFIMITPTLNHEDYYSFLATSATNSAWSPSTSATATRVESGD